MKKIHIINIIFVLIVAVSIGLAESVSIEALDDMFKPVKADLFDSQAGKNRVLIIGLDGFTWRHVNPLLLNGKLPNLKKYIDNGVAVKLKSTDFPSSAAAWPTIMTGCKPEKTGVHSFFILDPDSYKLNLNHSGKRQAKALWEIASEQKKRVFSINVPMSWPPDTVNGVLISGLLSPEGKPFTFPESLSDPMRRGGYKTGYRSFRQSMRFGGPAFLNSNQPMDVNALLDMALSQYRVAHYMLKNGAWDLGMVVFTLSDRLQHNEGVLGSDLIRFSYEQLDVLLGGLFAALPENTSVVFCSDHGFREYKHSFLTAEWLKRMDLITTNGLGDIDFSSSKIIPLDRVGNAGLYRFNIKGREKTGVLSQKDAKDILKLLKTGIGQLKDGDNRPIIEVIKKMESSPGGPDFMIKLRNDLLLTNKLDIRGSLVKILQQPVFDHEDDGFAVVYDLQKIQSNRKIEASVQDIAPLVLHLMNLPIPENMDGKVMESIFSPQWSKTHPVVIQGNSNRDVGQTEMQYENNDVMNKLKSLGYIN